MHSVNLKDEFKEFSSLFSRNHNKGQFVQEQYWKSRPLIVQIQMKYKDSKNTTILTLVKYSSDFKSLSNHTYYYQKI